jgi:ectoine hydroxylase-related dioxygenase (phytanoyl-CoA dioxygenase family)
LKPKFIHHPKSKEFIQDILQELGCDLLKTYFDVPRMRSSTSNNYLTSGIAYAFHPHSDCWYSAPLCQINIWIPISAIQPENSMAFHPRYWSQGIRNSSRDYNYSEWNRTNRHTAVQHVKADTRKQPRAEEPMELDPDIRVLLQPGAILLFSAAQMHSSVPNTSGRTRFSIDFRTVHLDDVVARRGAPNVDSACTGTTMGDYLRGTDLAHVPEDLIAMFDTPPHAGPSLVAGL